MTTGLLLPLILATQLFGLTGSWTGSGRASDSSGWSSDCETMSLSLVQTPGSFEVLSGGYRCGGIHSRWKPATIEIRGTELWRDGQKIGSFENGRVETWARSAGGKYLQRFDIFLEEGSPALRYREAWIENATSREVLTVEGRLERATENPAP